MEYRRLKENEVDFLKEMFYTALFVPDGAPAFPKEIIEKPGLAKYYQNWGSQSNDLAFVVLDEEQPVGAIWGRSFTAENKGYGFVDAQTPEIGIAILATYRNQGIGTQLMLLLEAAYCAKGVPALSLSVDRRNPARHLYSRIGFIDYQKEGTAITMVKQINNSRLIFDRFAQAYQDKYMDVSSYINTLDLLCASIKKQKPAILEIACGPGNITAYLIEKRPDFKLLGIDIAPKMIELAKHNIPNATFQVMDARSIDQLDQSFDAIICGFALPYLSKLETKHLIRATSLLLPVGGILYLSTMEGDYSKSGPVGPRSDETVQLYTYYYEEAYLTKVLEKNNFSVRHIIRQPMAAKYENSSHDLILIAEKIR